MTTTSTSLRVLPTGLRTYGLKAIAPTYESITTML